MAAFLNYEPVAHLAGLKSIIKTWRGPLPTMSVATLPLKDCPVAALLLRRLWRQHSCTIDNLCAVLSAATLDKLLQSISNITLHRLLLVDSDSDSSDDDDTDAHHLVDSIGDQFRRANGLAVQVGGSIVADMAALLNRWESEVMNPRDLLVPRIKSEIERIRHGSLHFLDLPEPEGGQIVLRRSPSPPDLGSPPPSPPLSPAPSPPSPSTQIPNPFRDLPARRSESWSPEHEVVDGRAGIQALLRTFRGPAVVVVESLSTRDCRAAALLLWRLAKQHGWNVPNLYAVRHASLLDGILDILLTVTVPRLLLELESNSVDTENLQEMILWAAAEAANAGGSIVNDLRKLEDLSLQLEMQMHYVDSREIKPLALEMHKEVTRLRNARILFIEPPEPQAPAKDFSPSPSPPLLGSPAETS